MTIYTFDKKNKGYIGDAFEMAVKEALNRRNADSVSSQGKSDFRYRNKNYDTKQNGSVLQYHPGERMIKGSNRVVYATHVAYTVEAETAETISISIDLGNTDMYCLDRADFLGFLLTEKGFCKVNEARGQLNVQTFWNYTKNAWHGAKGKRLEAWMDANRLMDDSIVEDILDGFYASL